MEERDETLLETGAGSSAGTGHGGSVERVGGWPEREFGQYRTADSCYCREEDGGSGSCKRQDGCCDCCLR